MTIAMKTILVPTEQNDAMASTLATALVFARKFDSGHPILIAPPAPLQSIGTNVLIAWNCSTEQARATTYALPVLAQASRVTVLDVEGGAAVPGPTSDEVCSYLRCHGIAVQQKS